MFSMTRVFTTGLLLTTGLGAPAFAANGLSYPHVLGSGENTTVDYGPEGYHHNVVGGGPIQLERRTDNDTAVVYLDNRYAGSRDKNHPVLMTRGQGRGATEVWMSPADAARVAQAGSAPRG